MQVLQDDCPLHFQNTKRSDDYHNMSGLPLFPFGYGLTYTTFEYSNIRIDKASIKKNESAQVQFDLKNTGAFASDEVVQLYIKDELASVARPVLELKGFQRVHLKPGENKTLSFAITPELLEMFDAQLKTVIEPGKFLVMIGRSSRDIELNVVLDVTE
jgi:beta-glucosidase